MPTFTDVVASVEFDVFCDICGAKLSDTCYIKKLAWDKDTHALFVEPCLRCMESFKEDGLKESAAEYESQLSDLRQSLEKAEAERDEAILAVHA